MLHYLIFVNSYSPEARDLLLNCGAIECEGLYDFIVVTNDASQVIAKLSNYDCSSVALITPRREISNEYPLVLANFKDTGRDNSSETIGCYNFIGPEVDVDMESVSGFLTIVMKGPINPQSGDFMPLRGRNFVAARVERTATSEEVGSYMRTVEISLDS